MDNNLPSYGSIQFKQKNCQEKINSDVTCNQLFLYKTPSLTDDAYEGKSVKIYDKSLIDNSVSYNKRSKENQNTMKPFSSVLSTVGADKNGVAVEPIAKR
jgi:high-affinity K+ transport system ATPase subunit B